MFSFGGTAFFNGKRRIESGELGTISPTTTPTAWVSKTIPVGMNFNTCGRVGVSNGVGVIKANG